MKYTVTFKAAAHRGAVKGERKLPTLKELFRGNDGVQVLRTYGRGRNALVEIDGDDIDELRSRHQDLIFAISGPAKAY